ncbi:hypothetical protein BSn5_19520 [Bacillus subtilis BSn5]|nr:hypothetical protein BSn5_19520 [Bacillus subtilis BSn5]
MSRSLIIKFGEGWRLKRIKRQKTRHKKDQSRLRLWS